jgi:hypothetical protein
VKPSVLSPRWTALRPHAVQLAYAMSRHRFNVVPAGRRSGKTERAKRKLVRRALSLRGVTHSDTPRYFAGAPTRDQAKRIYWQDLKALTKPFWRGQPSESELTIRLVTGAEIVVVGMDKPERIEGSPWDGGVLDEYANMKPEAWGANVRPALSDRNGWCDLIGVPEGRNHYYERYEAALAEMKEHGPASQWGAWTWVSADILPATEIAAAKRDLDPLTFSQEYEASFVNFEGRAYYAFTDANKERLRDRYNPAQPLILCLDFNVAPGVAAVCQELPLPNGLIGTAVIGEVYIENNSNTPAVCRKVLADWGQHQGRVEVFGDATGGAKGTAKVEGSDWDLVKRSLRDGDKQADLAGFGHRVAFYVKDANPKERARVNAMNSRCQSTDGTRRLMVDPYHAPHVVKDLEGVRTLKGGSGEIDKDVDPKLTHISDALGYYVEYRFPLAARTAVITTFAA